MPQAHQGAQHGCLSSVNRALTTAAKVSSYRQAVVEPHSSVMRSNVSEMSRCLEKEGAKGMADELGGLLRSATNIFLIATKQPSKNSTTCRELVRITRDTQDTFVKQSETQHRTRAGGEPVHRPGHGRTGSRRALH